MSRKKTKSDTGEKVYFSIYFSLSALLIAAIIFGLVKLWGFLKEYEASQQYHTTDVVLAELNSGDFSKLFDGIDDEISEYETIEELYDQITSRFTGEFTCTKSGKYSTDENPAYMIKCNGENAAVLYLKKESTMPEYGLDIFGYDKITGVTVQKNESATITLPDTCTFTINGKQAEGLSYTEEEISEAEKFGDYIEEKPVMRTYSIDGLMNIPDIKMFDKNGRQLPVSLENNVYSCALPTTDNEAALQAEEFAFEFACRYNEFVSYDIYFYSLTPYLIKGTELYENLRTYLAQYYGYHTGYEFRNKEIVSNTQYSDNCFAVNLKYQHVLFSYGKEIVYDISYTIYVAEIDGNWKTIDMIIN